MQGGFPPGGGNPYGPPGGAPPGGHGPPGGGGSPGAYGVPAGGYGAPPHPYGAPSNPGAAFPPGPAAYPAPGGFTPPPGTALAQPGAPFGVHPQLGVPYSDKSKVAAGLLQLLAGSFGVGRFYTGHTGLAVAQLLVCFVLPTLITIVTCGIGAFFYAAALWPMIDGILLLTSDSRDSEGRLLR